MIAINFNIYKNTINVNTINFNTINVNKMKSRINLGHQNNSTNTLYQLKVYPRFILLLSTILMIEIY